MHVEPEQALAFRVAAQGLAERRMGLIEAAGSWAVQDSPPGAAAMALHARAAGVEPGAVEAALEARTLVAFQNPRTALAVVPAEDVATHLAAHRPPDAVAAKAILATALPDGGDPLAVMGTSEAAVGDALDGRVLSKDALHEALRSRLPEDLLPYCRGCDSHHARRGVLSAAALAGRLCLAGREGRQPAYADGPTSGSRSSRWSRSRPGASSRAGTCAPSGRPHRGGAGGRTGWRRPPRVSGRAWRTSWSRCASTAGGPGVLAADEDALADPPAADGVRLLAAGDPLLQARHRELLVAGEADRKRLWPMVAAPGLEHMN